MIAEGGQGYNGEKAAPGGPAPKLPGLYQCGAPGFEYGDKYSSRAALLAAIAATDGEIGPKPALGFVGNPLWTDIFGGRVKSEELLLLVAVSTIDQILGLLRGMVWCGCRCDDECDNWLPFAAD